MEWLIANFEFIVYGLLIVVLIMMSVNIVINRRLSTFFTNSKFRLQASYVIEPATKEHYVSLTIYNNNLNDTRMTGFGFVYEKQNIDYYQSYLLSKNLDESIKVTIAARDSIVFKIKLEDLVTTLVDINRGQFKTRPLDVFITDSLGLMVTTPANEIRLHVQRHMKILKAQEKARLQQIRREHRETEKIKSQERRNDQKAKRQEWLEKQRLKLKSLFSKKKS